MLYTKCAISFLKGIQIFTIHALKRLHLNYFQASADENFISNKGATFKLLFDKLFGDCQFIDLHLD